MIFWILILILFVFFIHFDYSNSQKKHVLFLLVTCVLTFLSGFRDFSIGNDTIAYVDIFDNLKGINYSLSLIETRYELGYLYLNELFINLDLSVNYLFLFISIFISYSFSIFIKKYTHYAFFALFLFVGLRYYFASFNVLRQYIALSIFLIAITKFRITRKNLIIASFLGAFFHYSSFILLLLPIIYKVNISRRIILLFSISTGILLLLFNTVFLFVVSRLNLYSQYLSSKSVIGDSYIASLMYSLISLCVLLLVWKTRYLERNKDVHTNLFVWMLIFSFFFNILAIQVSLLDRFAVYFNIVTIILIPNCIPFINSKNRLFFKIIIKLIVIIYFIILLVYRPEWNNVFPYKLNFLN